MELAGFRLLRIGGPKWILDFSVYEQSGQVAAQEMPHFGLYGLTKKGTLLRRL